MSSFDVSVVRLYILDILGRPVTAIPDGGNVDFIDEIRLTAGFIAGLADDRSLGECAHLGTASASHVASGLGSGTSIKDRAQVEADLARWRA